MVPGLNASHLALIQTIGQTSIAKALKAFIPALHLQYLPSARPLSLDFAYLS